MEGSIVAFGLMENKMGKELTLRLRESENKENGKMEKE